MQATEQLASGVGIASACGALGVVRATFYRRRRGAAANRCERPRRPPKQALTQQERAEVLEVLNSPEFVDQAPAAAYATLLDQGRYLCSMRTMYRMLAGAKEVRERRNQLQRPHHPVPQLLATRPNQVWSWDVTTLLSFAKWTYFYLYVILDIFSRYVVGWMLAFRQSATLAERLIAETCWRQGIEPGTLTIHADRGKPMTSKPVALLLAKLGVTKTHSRPYVSNDNPYSESHFKTLKYRPDFPDRFHSFEHGQAFCQEFFPWYNTEHRHSGLGLLTPAMVHFGQASAVLAARQQTLLAAYREHPERFPRGIPIPQPLPEQVWINPPNLKEETKQIAEPVLTNFLNEVSQST
jgi:putative transposase